MRQKRDKCWVSLCLIGWLSVVSREFERLRHVLSLDKTGWELVFSNGLDGACFVPFFITTRCVSTIFIPLNDLLIGAFWPEMRVVCGLYVDEL